jgi:hypothetical protein
MNFERVKALHAQNNVNILEVKPGMFLEIHEKLGDEMETEYGNLKVLLSRLKIQIMLMVLLL